MGDSQKEADNLFLQVDEIVALKRVFCLSILDQKTSLEIVLASLNHVFAVGRRGLNGINSETKYRLQKYLSKRPSFPSCKGIQENKFYKIEQQRMIGVKLGLIDLGRKSQKIWKLFGTFAIRIFFIFGSGGPSISGSQGG